MERNCSVAYAGTDRDVAHADMGLDDSNVHTAFAKDPSEAALNAFLDYMSFIDATVILRTGSSFSGTACSIKDIKCQRAIEMDRTHVQLCLPPTCA